MQNIIKLNSVFDQRYIYTSIIIIFLIILRWIINKIIKNKVDNISQRYRWYKINTYSTVFFTIIVILPMWIEGFKSLFTFLGIFSAGLAIALRDIIVNFFAWIYVLIRRPFSTGDRIEINGVKGDVIDIKIMEFSLMEVGNWVDADQSTGRIINVPNSKILKNNIANFTKGFKLIWNEISILITFESDWEEAKSTLEKIAEENSIELNKNIKESIIHSARKNYRNLTPIVYTSIESSGIKLTIRYLCQPRMRRSSSEIIWEEILDKFLQNENIEFAYKTFRYYNNRVEKSKKSSYSEGKE